MLTIGKQVSHSLKIQKNDKAGMDNRFPYLSQVVRLIMIPNGWDPNWNDSDLQTGEQVFASVSCKSRAVSVGKFGAGAMRISEQMFTS
jgi:hypothetical protein